MNDVSAPAIRLEQATIRFGETVLQFDCAVEKGRVVAVTGPSGSGKSTLFNLIAGFETPDSGAVRIGGAFANGLDPSERPVSVIFQEHNLFSHLDVATNIGLGIDPSLRFKANDRSRIESALSRVGLAGFGKRRPSTLSGGERQRVALARALVRDKPILLLDEPFAALDPGLRAGMSALVLDLHRETGNTVMIITHNPEDVRTMADSVIFLDAGRILLHEPTARFLDDSHAAVRQFLGKPVQ